MKVYSCRIYAVLNHVKCVRVSSFILLYKNMNSQNTIGEESMEGVNDRLNENNSGTLGKYKKLSVMVNCYMYT